jgi:cytochrome d ubiquinol oxidase subunit I
MFDVVWLSRMQFAITTLYHFLFVPLTLGLSIYIAWFETMAHVKKDTAYLQLSSLFTKLLIINFAMGVVTGIVQEFQFGMNWSGYSRFVGDIFGAPLAIEALAAFFLESTFLGIFIFGRNKLSRPVHLASIWLVAFSSNLSAFWILVANSFMQEPVGFVLRNGRAEMNDFAALITNPHVFVQFPHTVLAGLVTSAIFILGVSAWKLRHRERPEVFIKGVRFGAVLALATLLLVMVSGDIQGKHLVKTQPMKMAAAEALWETSQPAPFAVVALIDEENKENSFEIAIPKVLSFMSYNNFTGKVYGINELQAAMQEELGPGNYIPPVKVCFWSFRIMIGLGMLMLLVVVLALFFLRKNKIQDMPRLLKVLVWMLPVPFLCNSLGWVLTEVGRQPFIVYKLMLTSNSVSSVLNGSQVLASVIGFTLIYGVLAVIAVYLGIREIKAIPAEEVPE